MTGVYIYLGIVILLFILFVAWILYIFIKPTIKLQKARNGGRTKFEIDLKDKDYEYYKKKIDKWLDDTGFKKYNSKKLARYYKYRNEGLRFTFGFNYYKQDDKLIIETWLVVLGAESPISWVSYSYDENETNLLGKVVAHNEKDKELEKMPTVLDQQGKDIYIDMLRELLDLPEYIVEDYNKVNIKNL
ncbi:MAG: hypothetical protein IJE04_00640 [Bacilli bacterium]|nr:hypothetical protein [Bacilli bacterium]